MVDINQFIDYANFYNILYNDKDYYEEASRTKDLLVSLGINPGSSLLEFGSGTGIHGSILGDMGYRVLGIERSRDMLKLSPRKNVFSNFEEGDIRYFRPNKKFNAVISLFHVISYQVSNHDISCVFQNAFDSLHAGGAFIFDCWFTPGVLTIGPSVRSKEAENEEFRIVRDCYPVSDFTKNVVDVHYKFKVTDKKNGQAYDFTEIHTLRHFGIPELKLLGDLAGFEDHHFFSSGDGSVQSDRSWAITCVFTKPD